MDGFLLSINLHPYGFIQIKEAHAPFGGIDTIWIEKFSLKHKFSLSLKFFVLLLFERNIRNEK